MNTQKLEESSETTLNVQNSDKQNNILIFTPKQKFIYPPSFIDLGKQSKSVISNKFINFEKCCINYKVENFKPNPESKNSLAMSTKTSVLSQKLPERNLKDINASTEVLLKLPEHDVTYKQTIDQNMKAKTEVSLSNLANIKNSNCKFSGAYSREGFQQFSSSFSYKQDFFNVNGEIVQPVAGPNLPTFKATCVFGKLPTFIGLSSSYDLSNNQLSYEIKGQFLDDRLEFTRKVDSTSYGASVYYKFDDSINFGAQYSCKRGDSEGSMKFEFGSSLKVNESLDFAAKITESGKIGLGGSFKVNNGINLAASALIDSINFNQSTPQFGISVDLSF